MSSRYLYILSVLIKPLYCDYIIVTMWLLFQMLTVWLYVQLVSCSLNQGQKLCSSSTEILMLLCHLVVISIQQTETTYHYWKKIANYANTTSANS